VLRNLGTGVIVAAAAIVRAVIHNGGGRRVEFSHGQAEIVPPSVLARADEVIE
jgi:hypothetical protein